ncbi:MAG: CDP-alcohol phosphatidyltransferase family protein [Candidatus Levybacteria bacterium]|nr:CDP-alcohol phosphatidyltransferase family protein [Candidatus Levybacteria bacterium]
MLLGVAPTVVTMAGVVIVTTASFVLMSTRSVSLTLMILIVGFLADAFDGPLARLKGTASAYGAWLDTFCDRLNEVIFGIAITMVYIMHFTSVEQQFVGLLALGLGFLVSFSKASAEEKGIHPNWDDRWFLGYPGRLVFLLGGLGGTLVLPYSPETVMSFTLLFLFLFNFCVLVSRIRRIRQYAPAAHPRLGPRK